MKKKIICILFCMLLIATAVPNIKGNFIKNENFVDNTNEKNNSERATHTVLGEFGTATWGLFPRYAHAALKEIYAEGQLDFYYVSLVYDVNPITDFYVHDYYNFTVFPILWWDGGFIVDAGAVSTQEAKEKYITSINSSLDRSVLDVDIDLLVSWRGGTEMQVDYTIYNNELSTYEGTIKVYITENESSEGWRDSGGYIYTMAFLDWAFYEEISIPAGETYSNTTTWDGESNSFPNITEENMIIIAAVFNDEWHQGYSYPPTGNPFDAYYADETVAVFPPFNLPPEKPLIDGPISGAVGKEYDYTFVTTDPENDYVYYYVEWGDGEIEDWIGPFDSGEEQTFEHSWSEIGVNEIRAKAKDYNEAESNWSETFTVTISNPPGVPDINGPHKGDVGAELTFTFNADDPDGENVKYIIHWGDGKFDTTDLYPSGTDVTVKHTWDIADLYNIKAKAQDSNGVTGLEGNYEVSIPRNRAINTVFVNFLISHPNLFPILRQLMKL